MSDAVWWNIMNIWLIFESEIGKLSVLMSFLILFPIGVIIHLYQCQSRFSIGIRIITASDSMESPGCYTGKDTNIILSLMLFVIQDILYHYCNCYKFRICRFILFMLCNSSLGYDLTYLCNGLKCDTCRMVSLFSGNDINAFKLRKWLTFYRSHFQTRFLAKQSWISNKITICYLYKFSNLY